MFERLQQRWGEGDSVLTAEVVKQVYEAALKQALEHHESERLMGHHSHPSAASRLRVDRTVFEVLGYRRPEPSPDELRAWGWSDDEIDDFGFQMLVFEQRRESAIDAVVDAHFQPYDPPPGLEHHLDEERAGLVRAAFGGWAAGTAQAQATLPTIEPILASGSGTSADAPPPFDASRLLERLTAIVGSAVAGQPIQRADIPAVWQGLTVQAAMHRFIAESAHGKRWSNDSKRRALGAAWLLDGVINGKPCYEVDQSHLRRLTDVFDELPRNRGKSETERQLTLDELLMLTQQRRAEGVLSADGVGLEPGTINGYVQDLKRLYDWLRDSEKLPVGHLYWRDLRRAKESLRDERDKRAPWSEAEARTIFALPMWTGCDGLTKQGRKRPGALIIHDAAY